ncbi:MAG TPA: hypothetical protein PKA57_02925 [Parvibaculum sp.]|uniref:hypothetical protein n=1 Tax=Parvibaculum sp. TaxID=2024848 RepID=UPI002C1C1F73|nr:hypothetical protein [Parvibaculum sp.]HMM13552.1 hypothetical protein [Parvibaculum sp.]
MVMRSVVPMPAKPQMRSRSYRKPANMTERCLLSIIGVLAAFMTLVQGMLAVQALPPAIFHQSSEIYWVIAAFGVWLPSICLFASILGVVIPGWASMLMLIVSPVASIGGYLFYTYVPIEPLLRQVAMVGGSG